MKPDIDELIPVQRIPDVRNRHKHYLHLLNDVHLKNLIIEHVKVHDDHQYKYYQAKIEKIVSLFTRKIHDLTLISR